MYTVNKINDLTLILGARGSIAVKALCYKLEGCGFRISWGERLLSIYLLQLALVFTQPLTEMSTMDRNKNIPGEEGTTSVWGWQPYHHLSVKCLCNVGSLTSHNPISLHGDTFTFYFCTFISHGNVITGVRLTRNSERWTVLSYSFSTESILVIWPNSLVYQQCSRLVYVRYLAWTPDILFESLCCVPQSCQAFSGRVYWLGCDDLPIHFNSSHILTFHSGLHSYWQIT
jgi:hypothetical protein